MPWSVKTPTAVAYVNITSNSGPGGTAVSAGVSLDLTPERMRLLQELAGSAKWSKQLPQEEITWQEVEEIVAGHVPRTDK
jgi:hypothetical protein